MTEHATAPRGIDFNDVAADLGDDAIRESINAAPPPEPKFPHGYALRKDGLHYDDEGVICSPFDVVAMTRDQTSNSWGKLLRWKDADNTQHQVAVPMRALAGDGSEVRQTLMDGGLFVAPGKKRRDALTTFLLTVTIDRRARAVSKVGWCDGQFVLPDRTIDAGGSDIAVYQGTASIEHEFHTQGTLEGWQNGVARLAAGNSRVAISLCAAFVGPLLAAVGAEGGGLHFRGASSIGKSTTLNAAASVWGAPSFVRAWRATSNGLEGIAEQSNDCLLILDELAQLDPREAGSVAYLLANGCGKSRASQTGEARSAKRWLTFFLSSGEISLAEHARSDGRGRRSPAGQEVRILDIEADAANGLGLFDTLHEFGTGEALSRALKDSAATDFGVAGPEFVRRLIGNLEVTAQQIREGIDRFVASNLPAGATGQVSRACRRFGLIAMAGEIATHLGVLPWDRGEAVQAAKNVFTGWVASRGGAGDAEDAAAVEQVAEFISTHGASRFQALNGEGTIVVHNRAGFWRDDGLGKREYLIPTSTWRNEVCRGLNVKNVSALLLARGHLTTDGSGKASMSVRAPGMGKTRFYIVNESIFGGPDE